MVRLHGAVYIAILLFISVYQTDTIDSTREITFNGTIFGFFTGSSSAFSRENGIRNCIGWGGNLATINSLEEDAQLFSLTNPTHFACWIGLVKNAINQDTRGYGWVDGSDNMYRKYTPNSAPTKSGMKFRLTDNRMLLGGWVDYNWNENSNCYFCNKLANSRGCEFNNNEICYRTYQMDTTINWNDAQSDCVNWGGNLASITSFSENQYIHGRRPLTGIDCWIGMYMGNTNGKFTWNDGSPSTYGRWRYDAPNQINGCVEWNDQGSNSWLSTNCNTGLKCYICKKILPTLINLRDCEFRSDRSCYRTYELINPINWYNAQSSCIRWGGNLASITSEDGNTFLYYRTPYSANNCWIGLTDRNRNNGAYYWIDGEQFSYNKWSDGAPNNVVNSNDCTRNKIDGMNRWEVATCISTTKCYICKKSITSQSNDDEIFGELINENLGYQELSRNTILYRNANLACGYVNNTDSIQWIYTRNSEYRINETIPATGFNPETLISWLTVSNSKQGFYQCRIEKEDGTTAVYTVGVFDPTSTTVAEVGKTYNYTVGIDSQNILLLCDPMNSSTDFLNLEWQGNEGSSLNNPIDFSNLPSTMSMSNHIFVCQTSDIQVVLKLQVPIITVSYNPSFIKRFTSLSPQINALSINGFTQNLTLSTNIYGRWKLPDGPYHLGSTFSQPFLSQQYTGLFQFYLYNWDGVEILGMQINITATDITGIFTKSAAETTQWIPFKNGSSLFLTELTNLICVGPNVTSTVEWYNEILNLTKAIGVSRYDISKSRPPGYYHCRVDGTTTYSIFVANQEIIDEIFDFSRTANYTLGSPTLLYHSVASIADSQIHWTTENVEQGSEQTFIPEYSNPVPLSTVFSDVGGGQHAFTCFYRKSPAIVLGSLDLNLKDTTSVTISYEGFKRTFKDIDNPSFPNPEQIKIPYETRNITFDCSLQICKWKVQVNETVEYTKPASFKISVFQQENEGTYYLVRTTISGIEYTTASVYIKGKIPETMASNTFIIYVIAIGIPVALCLLVIVVVTLIVIAICSSKKRRRHNQLASRQFKNEPTESPKSIGEQNMGTPYANLNFMRKKGYEDLDDEIDETTFTQEVETSNYQNITEFNQNDEKNYEQIPENPRMVPIVLDAYKMHVNELWGNEGSLESEYEALGGKTHRYACTYATLEQNRIKNRFKLIYPYDKSRVVLKAIVEEDPTYDYINASFMPGLYVNNTFIAAQAPKDSTLKRFWQMIIENNVVNIVMLTNLAESGRIKCEAYFPVKVGKMIIIGLYEIILGKEDVLIGYTIRYLTITYNGEKRQIKQFHFTAWPDHDVPALHDELLLFVEKVQMYQIVSEAPMLVHCSAGVGRSGTFLALFNLTAAIKEGKAISIYKLVHEMREHRPQMVQTFAQYKFIYLSVLEMLLGNTSVANNEFTATYKLYMQSESEGYVSVFFQQFSELGYQCEKGFRHVCAAAVDECNKDKNPIKTVLPSDKNRVILFSPHWGGDYINATCFDGTQYIVTVNPTQNTLQDFFQLIYQVEASMVVFLTTPKELQLIQSGKSDRVVYWPKQGEPLNTNAFELKSLASEKFSSLIRNKICLKHAIEDSKRTFQQIISTKWNERGEAELESVVMLLQAMLKHKQDYPAAPIIIHCTDGAGKSGVLFTVFKAILDSREKNFIDIFHIVKKLRNERMNFVSTLNHFVSCFSLMNEYCSTAV